MALARFVDGVRKDLKDGVLAAVQPVRAEDDARALAHAVRALEGRDALVAVIRFFASAIGVSPFRRNLRF